jgi:uncharacterized protein YjbJ (UPF0337 family)
VLASQAAWRLAHVLQHRPRVSLARFRDADKDRSRRMRRQEEVMNRAQMQGNWKQIRGKAKEKWGKLTDNDLDVINGHLEQLVGKIQERYGIARQEAEKQVKEFWSHEPPGTSRY